jgi:DNA-binding NarL/FixJ family response regulator
MPRTEPLANLPYLLVRFRAGTGRSHEEGIITSDGGIAFEITPRERDVLLALCRPAASAELFVEPASVREMAHALSVTEAAVKQHLLNLYEKFGIVDGEERRRVALAREALRTGAIEIPGWPPPETQPAKAREMRP